MDYARGHIRTYWGVAYRRTIGLALVAIAIVLSMGLTFTILRAALAVGGFASYLFFWLLLIFLAVVTVSISFLHSHVSSVKFMNDFEHKMHSKYTAIWLISLVIGIVVFMIPLLLTKPSIEPIVLLFTLGGILLVLYTSIKVIFKHSYWELVIGGGTFWIMFLFGLFQVNHYALSQTASSNFALYFAAMSITIIAGFTGLAMILNSSRESIREVARAGLMFQKQSGRQSPARPKPARKKQASGRRGR